MYLQGQIIKHKRFLDVAFWITKSYCFEHKMRFKGYWINQGFSSSYVIDIGKIAIKNEDLKEWLVCSEPKAQCIRNVKWMEIR